MSCNEDMRRVSRNVSLKIDILNDKRWIEFSLRINVKFDFNFKVRIRADRIGRLMSTYATEYARAIER